MSFYSNLPVTQSETGTSGLNPTVFEIFSSNEIDALLPSSVRYILTNYWILRNPNWYTLQVNNYFKEWFEVALKGAIEWYHIKNYNSTFVDKFYGLQRFNTANDVLFKAQSKNQFSETWPLQLQLTQKQRVVVFLQKIIIPYLKDRLDEVHNHLNRPADLVTNSERNYKYYLKQYFRKLYPLIKKFFYISNLVIRVFFLTGKIGSFSLLDYMFNIGYTRALFPLEKKQMHNLNTSIGDNKMKKANLYSFQNSLKLKGKSLVDLLSQIGSQAFPAFLFMLRVYQWWTTQDITVRIQKKLNDLDKEVPRPPTTSRNQEEASSDKCPICKDTIRNPCILETGYVTCYPCALAYLPEHEGRCPVTNKQLLGCQFDESTKEWQVVNGIRRLLV
ncbi:hypothetical protein Kpol_1064p3 [Vanderwaltozyma polyspora DSM 70294]|uniref:Peroxisome assembly protein 12 n=1 Tax=Vanderwaltozyma polyspora (strain ATCC 22028 / DSM 70294 / BCRC 21397 / CBS 2163 / NBRC 10782 / NRRL Y-8283 / UCD 57-17) TaxID=436907 RepID=A7TMC9_VANPO|nr:uncharacterized protein Kpol_1064p3 [Vanderwaltozyma polyspora DSM 70294]EDO16523.1 hypothetical protein Kpol_1064p3 [Vanderwaltozyma polyspora DSM 70294]